MFLGTYEATIDAKGRVSFPVRFRDRLEQENRLFITSSLDAPTNCVVAYTPPAWDAFAQRLADASATDPSLIRIRRLVIAGAAECAIDRVGRVLLPPHLRDHAALDKDVVWLGVGKTVELWDAHRWQEEERRLRETLGQDVHAITERGM